MLVPAHAQSLNHIDCCFSNDEHLMKLSFKHPMLAAGLISWKAILWLGITGNTHFWVRSSYLGMIRGIVFPQNYLPKCGHQINSLKGCGGGGFTSGNLGFSLHWFSLLVLLKVEVGKLMVIGSRQKALNHAGVFRYSRYSFAAPAPQSLQPNCVGESMTASVWHKYYIITLNLH